ncbi:MAG TPA: ABC transporter ATP-binding protein [Tepidisphaeraceae bacterium]|nr:ABC transporter ATP-binding protein [Tepidisphaeraceae bacterium]
MIDLLYARDLSFAYTDRPVLRGVCVSLDAGQIVALIGPNGSGKSTLIKLLLGHLHPLQGEVRWEGRSLRQWRRRELARRVAYLPQSPTFEPEHRVIDVLRLGRAPYWQTFGIESTHDAQVVARVADLLELTDLLNRRMDRLSGGQRQRVFVGRCLVQDPAAMLLDEPNTFLDLRHQIDLGLLLKRLASQQRLGVLMASHDLNLAAAFADRMLLLSDGALVREGPPDQVLDPQVLGQVYGLPMRRLEIGDGSPPVVVPQIKKTPEK